ncbi:hypothetical protein K3495_g5382 [Podosphaera aphanis]|nr:hypothetical protein K3495_g5382 [Podosphaera aphanis]
MSINSDQAYSGSSHSLFYDGSFGPRLPLLSAEDLASESDREQSLDYESGEELEWHVDQLIEMGNGC